VPSFFDTLKSLIAPQIAGQTADVDNSLLHAGWEQRDEAIYPALFGEAEGAPIMLEKDVFQRDFGRKDVHPFWLHHGMIVFPPAEARRSWLYATSGMSNAFDSEVGEWSGLGVEFILETETRADWAIEKLSKLMAYNLLIAIGHYRDQSDMRAGSLIRLDAPIDGEESALRNVVALKPADHPAEFKLVTGMAELLQMVAVTDKEADFIDQEGADAFAAKLREQAAGEKGLYSVIPHRQSLV